MNVIDQLKRGVLTMSAEETRQLAELLAQELPPTATLALHGDLGVGKTTFVQGLALGFGIKESVTSPTFSIYTFHHGKRLLAHLDAYRLGKPEEIDALLLDEFLKPPYCLAIEWPEKLGNWVPNEALHIDFGIINKNHTLKLRV
jgi:tRNA threonylcarbamoyladenosine biosynthesis protein TsaE